MASMAIPAPSVAHPQPREWITPQEQVRRLTTPFIEEQLHREGNRQRLESMPKGLLYPIIESVARSSLKGLILTDPGSGAKERVPLLFDLGVQPLFDIDPLPPILTDWHTALERRRALPDKVPALPRNMPQILKGKCPVWGDEQKLDGTHTKYLDTWSLCLKTRETVNELKASVKAYGERALNDRGERLYPDNNPLQFGNFWDAARREHADVRSNDEPYWILHTNTVLPGSRNRTYREQVQMVADLSKRAFVNFEVPSLSETATVCFDRQIARGESLYSAGNPQNVNVYTYTRVKEATQGYNLVVGGSAPSGVDVYHSYGYVHESIGVAARREFSKKLGT